MTMSNAEKIRQRLESGFHILATIRRRRLETGSPELGSAVERAIIDLELRELDQQLSSDPAFHACEPVRFPPDIRLGGRSLGMDLLRARRSKNQPDWPPLADL